MTKRKSLLEAFRPRAAQSAPASPAGGPAKAGLIETVGPRRTFPVELAAIRAGKRLRATLDKAKLNVIAASMASIGLQTPILLRPWRALEAAETNRWGAEDAGLFALVAGAHRLAAAEQLGWTRIEAIVVDGTPDEMRLIEIDENLARAELTALGRARFLAARKAIYARAGAPKKHTLYPQDTDFTEQNRSPNFGLLSFSSDAMDRTGLSKSAVYRAVEIGEGLCEEAAVALADTPLAERESDLHRLARMPAAKQRVIAGLCRAPVGPATLEKALAALEGKGGAKRAKHRAKTPAGLPALQRAWRAADVGTRRCFLQWVDAEAKDPDPGTKPAKELING